MTPKEKAEDLLLKYSILKDGHNHLVKQCALICCDEVLCDMGADRDCTFWLEVKKEIENYEKNI